MVLLQTHEPLCGRGLLQMHLGLIRVERRSKSLLYRSYDIHTVSAVLCAYSFAK